MVHSVCLGQILFYGILMFLASMGQSLSLLLEHWEYDEHLWDKANAQSLLGLSSLYN